MTSPLAPALAALASHRSLTAEQARAAFEAMMRGEASEAEMGAFLGMLSLRLPTPDELLGAASVMREQVTRVPTRVDPDALLDTAGTGGAPKTFNVSTVAALIAAAGGVPVAKHGNRSRTGRGSAEVLVALGVDVDASPEVQARCLDEAGVCFCFAIHHHPATRNVMPVRRALGIPTLFNLLGPLTNPAGARRQVLGVYDGRFLRPMAEALVALDARRAVVLHSEDGLDEVSISAPTDLAHVEHGGVRLERIAPEDFGFARAPREAVVARDLDHAAQLVRDLLEGRERGPARSMAVLSGAVALLVGGAAFDLRDGVAQAEKRLDDGSARARLDALISATRD